MELSHALAASVLLAFFVAYLFRKRIIVHLFDRIATFYNRQMEGRKKRLFEGLKLAQERRGDGRLVILDLGCGPGANFRFFPPGSDVICVDPNPHFDPIVRRNVREFPDVRVSRFLVGIAENLRDVVEAESVDAVVVTTVLCNVTDVARSLQEIIRVLKPGGLMFFMEHVYAKSGALRRVHWALRRFWRTVFDGCDLCRDTDLHIRSAGFSNVDMQQFDALELIQPCGALPLIARVVVPHISGTATK